MNNTTTPISRVAAPAASGGLVLAIITIIARILAAYGYSVDADTAAAAVALLTPFVHLGCVKLGLDPSNQVNPPPAQG